MKTEKAAVDLLKRRHLVVAWWTLLLFVVMGSVLEALHGFKVPWYVSPSTETRRLMWTLSHAHGTLMGLINLGFAATLGLLPEWSPRLPRASSLLLLATALIPAGFFLGGARIYAGDPGIGVVLVPLGALALIVAITLVALICRRSPPS
jgi:hypothetical protein